MEIIKFIDNKMHYRGCILEVGAMQIVDDVCLIHVTNSENDFDLILVANETSINDVIQTSAQMIIDTLSNG